MYNINIMYTMYTLLEYFFILFYIPNKVIPIFIFIEYIIEKKK